MKHKKRLDQLLCEQLVHYSRQQIQSWIMQGKVQVEGRTVTKPGFQVTDETVIHYSFEEPKYVSRAGFKLEKALDDFNVNVSDHVVLDAGISTGGFTDCLLQRGARKVYGVDVGYGQVHEKIRSDERVVLLERTNLRDLETVGELVDLITLDLSFISVLKVMDVVCKILKETGELLVLIKPQFEARREDVGAGGIVKDSRIHERVIQEITHNIQACSFECIGLIESPLLGGSGNKEFLAYFKKISD